MTRVTFGAYRAGVRDGRVTLGSLANSFMPPTPFPSASAAITRYHRESPEAAARELDRSFNSSSYWGQRGSPQAGWANAMRACFETYRQMAQGDPRPAFATGLNRDLAVPPDELGIHIDVVLLDEDGYVPRLVLWDKNDLTVARARLYAAPAWRVLKDELGDDRVPGVEVWHLRTVSRVEVDATEAQGALADVARVVHRVAA